jgi:hypothetical protein
MLGAPPRWKRSVRLPYSSIPCRPRCDDATREIGDMPIVGVAYSMLTTAHQTTKKSDTPSPSGEPLSVANRTGPPFN